MSLGDLFSRQKYETDEEEVLIGALFGEIDPQQQLKEAMDALKQGDQETGIRLLKEQTGNEESRIRIMAWNELRNLQMEPPDTCKKELLGFVIEVGMEDGCDYLSAYPDGRARYFNYSGAKIFWEGGDKAISDQIEKLMQAARKVLFQIGVWEEARRPAPENGVARMTLLSPEGLHFGEAPFHQLYQDTLAHETMENAINLMKLLTEYRRAD